MICLREGTGDHQGTLHPSLSLSNKNHLPCTRIARLAHKIQRLLSYHIFVDMRWVHLLWIATTGSFALSTPHLSKELPGTLSRRQGNDPISWPMEPFEQSGLVLGYSVAAKVATDSIAGEEQPSFNLLIDTGSGKLYVSTFAVQSLQTLNVV